jgi:hypothetical protein
MDLRWIAGNLDSDSEASRPVLGWIGSESRRKRIRLRRVSLWWSLLFSVSEGFGSRTTWDLVSLVPAGSKRGQGRRWTDRLRGPFLIVQYYFYILFCFYVKRKKHFSLAS